MTKIKIKAKDLWLVSVDFQSGEIKLADKEEQANTLDTFNGAAINHVVNALIASGIKVDEITIKLILK